MAFTVKEFTDLLKLLDEHPEWREELRRRLLTDDLLALPEREDRHFRQILLILQELAEAQKRTEDELQALARRVEGLTQRVDDLAAQVQALTKRVDDLTKRVDDLAAQVQALTKRVDDLTVQLQALAVRFEELTGQVQSLSRRVDRFGARLGVETERQGRARLAEVLQRKGFRLLEPILAIARGPLEVDGLARVETPDGRRLWVLLEATERLFPRNVSRFIRKLRHPALTAYLRAEDPTAEAVLPYLYGTTVYRHSLAGAQEAGIGILTDPVGEVIEPRSWVF